MAEKLDEVNAEFEDMGCEADEYVDDSDIREAAGKNAVGDVEESAEMIDLDAVDICNSKKSASSGNGKILSIEKYRAV